MEDRLQAIEEAVYELQLAINQLATKSEVISRIELRQNQIDHLEIKLNSLKSQVELLQAITTII